jgi:hypothetical protein
MKFISYCGEIVSASSPGKFDVKKEAISLSVFQVDNKNHSFNNLKYSKFVQM